MPNRRHFLRAAGLAGLALGTGLGSAPARTTTPDHRAVAPTGTTLHTAATAPETPGYQRLRAGPGWPLDRKSVV